MNVLTAVEPASFTDKYIERLQDIARNSTFIQPLLQLHFQDGTSRQYVIFLQGKDFYLDNRHHFRTREARCF